jgi:hypothetical protein
MVNMAIQIASAERALQVEPANGRAGVEQGGDRGAVNDDRERGYPGIVAHDGDRVIKQGVERRRATLAVVKADLGGRQVVCDAESREYI